jgi:PKD repeat protein
MWPSFGPSIKLLFLLISIGILGSLSDVNAQCLPRSSFYYGEILPGCGTFTQVTDFGPGEYFRMPVTAGVSYTISTCPSSFDTQLTGFQGTITGTNVFYNNDVGPICATTRASITYTPTFTDFLRVNVNQNNCLPGGSTSAVVQVRENLLAAPSVTVSSNCLEDNPVLSVNSPNTAYTYFWQTSPTGTSTTNPGNTFSPTVPGTYYVRPRSPINTLSATSGGCWSPASSGIVINAPSPVTSVSATACDSYTWPANGQTYTLSGFYSDTATNAAGCDSIIRLNLTITNSSSNMELITDCDSYTWPVNGMTYTSSGTYRDTLMNAAGCDSFAILMLTINNSTSSQTPVTACDSYTWAANNLTYTSSGTYYDTLTNAANCDSFLTLNLTISNSSSSSASVTACDSYVWAANNMTYTSSGVYRDTLTNASNCDSFLTLNLTINSSSSSSMSATACDSYVWAANNLSYTSSGTYVDTLVNSVNCDSIVTLNLTILNSTGSSMVMTSCDSFTWSQNGMTYYQSGTYYDTVTNAVNCDSVIALNLTISTVTISSTSATACDSYTWPFNGMTYSSSGLYSDTLTNAGGCDSIARLNLTVNSSSGSTVQQTACDSFTWAQNGMTYSASGLYFDTISNAVGCDSVITLSLIINNSSQGLVSQTACDSFSWSQNGMTYYQTGTFYDTITNAVGCDSIIALNLTVNFTGYGTVIQTACDSFTWGLNGTTYYSSGTYLDTIQTTSGCDSIVRLNLTINSSTYWSKQIVECDSFTWSQTGVTYYSSGTYLDTLTNAAGCDSILILYLQVGTSSIVSSSEIACDSFVWAGTGNTYYTSGLYTDTLSTSEGCDSIVRLQLTINSSSYSTQVETACDSFTWAANGLTYSSSGSYTETSTNAAGCDSIITLNLTINSSWSNTQTETACDSFFWQLNGMTYTASGTYSETYTAANGCDSTYILDLTILNPGPVAAGFSFTVTGGTTVNFTNSSTGGTSYDWDFGDGNTSTLTDPSHTYTSSGTFTVTLIASNDCYSDTITKTVMVSTGIGSVEDEIKVELFPNPSDGQFNVNLSGNLSDEVQIEIVDLNGKIVFTNYFETSGNDLNISINLSHVAVGTYLLEVNDGSISAIRRIVLQ